MKSSISFAMPFSLIFRKLRNITHKLRNAIFGYFRHPLTPRNLFSQEKRLIFLFVLLLADPLLLLALRNL
jgi:hypothetical protein